MMVGGLNLSELSRTERRLFEALSVGSIVSKEHLLSTCFDDELIDEVSLRTHIWRLRQKVEPRGLLIHFVSRGDGRGYLMSRKISKEE